MFCDASYVPSEAMFNGFVLGKSFLAYLFAASSYQNTDHIIKHLGLDQKSNYNKTDIRVFLMLYLPDSTFDLPWVKLAKFLPVEVSKAYLGLLSSVVLVMSETSSTQLNKLAAVAKDMPLINFSKPQNLDMMASGYFHVSNLSGKDRYNFKQWAVNNYQHFMAQYLSQATVKTLKNIKKKPNIIKPTIAIVHEHYRDNHAMYRCYHSMIVALKETFNVVGFAGKAMVDELGQADHHSFTEYDNIFEIETIIADITAIKPDIVFYPSIGMSSLPLMLATQRLAPIQCACPGHPSSSRFKNIDYMLHNYMGVDSKIIQGYFSEKTVEMGSDMQPMPHAEFKIDDTDNSNVYKICVNGVVPKVTPELIDICQKITAGADKPVEFQFFIGSPKQDLEYYAAISYLRRYLPNANVHLYQNYNAYMNVLAQCKFAIPTLPFGGSNSNMDCLRIKLPKLYIADDRAFVGYTDLRIWQSLGIDIGFCHSIDNLVTRAIELIEDEEALAGFKNELNTFDLEAYDKKIDSNELDNRMSDTFKQLITSAL
jgi:predicted O-linked N-acetylglucosamine transferase (SPINDLY family)